MSEIMITIAVEDILSEVALRKVLQATGKDYNVVLSLSGKGYGYLKAKASSFNNSAKGFPILMLTDQDTDDACPPNKILDWLGKKPRHPNFLFRVAVMEVEAWIMGDRAALAEYIQVPLNKVPERVDGIQHPKEFLVNLARSSGNSSIRDDFVPRQGATGAGDRTTMGGSSGVRQSDMGRKEGRAVFAKLVTYVRPFGSLHSRRREVRSDCYHSRPASLDLPWFSMESECYG